MNESILDLATATAEELSAEVARLRGELAERDRANAERERVLAERKEFSLLYPDVDPDTLPEDIRTQSGIPLSAAYALYERQKALLEAYAETVNQENAEKASGNLEHDGGSDGFFTLEEVRRMSPAEIRQNYRTVMSSLGSRLNQHTN